MVSGLQFLIHNLQCTVYGSKVKIIVNEQIFTLDFCTIFEVPNIGSQPRWHTLLGDKAVLILGLIGQTSRSLLL